MDCGPGAPTDVISYTTGVYNYVYIAYGDTNSGELYFQDGTFYCADAPGFSCVAVYGLSPSTAEVLWSCQGKSNEQETSEMLESESNALNMQLYPNPSNGAFNVDADGLEADSEYLLNIYDLQGRLIHSSALDSQQGQLNLSFDMPDLSIGTYLVQIMSQKTQLSKRIQIIR